MACRLCIRKDKLMQEIIPFMHLAEVAVAQEALRRMSARQLVIRQYPMPKIREPLISSLFRLPSTITVRGKSLQLISWQALSPERNSHYKTQELALMKTASNWWTLLKRKNLNLIHSRLQQTFFFTEMPRDH
jgi:hypothetical protein